MGLLAPHPRQGTPWTPLKMPAGAARGDTCRTLQRKEKKTSCGGWEENRAPWQIRLSLRGGEAERRLWASPGDGSALGLRAVADRARRKPSGDGGERRQRRMQRAGSPVNKEELRPAGARRPLCTVGKSKEAALATTPRDDCELWIVSPVAIQSESFFLNYFVLSNAFTIQQPKA